MFSLLLKTVYPVTSLFINKLFDYLSLRLKRGLSLRLNGGIAVETDCR